MKKVVSIPENAVTFEHPDPDRNAKEEFLRALDADTFRESFAITREAAKQSKESGQMETLYSLTRGMKTLQRIGKERGIILKISRIGFLKDAEIEVPSDFDQMGQAEIIKTLE